MDKFKIINKKSIDDLPKHSGVYCFISEGKTIYIGKAINIKNRVKSHFNQPSYRDDLFMGKVDEIGYFETYSEIEALILEANLIKKHQPKFNVVWKDGKNYFYVAIEKNNAKIPFVYITHQPFGAAQGKKIEYIGPFVEGMALKKTLKYLRRAFPYYTVAKHPKTKCTYCHLDLCPGPEIFENPSTSSELREYRRNIKKLILILQGRRSAVLNSLKKEMSALSKLNKFEEAAKVRDKISNLQQVMSHAGVIEPIKQLATGGWEKTQNILRGLTGLSKNISKIECYDVSNMQGKSATGSMVAFVDGAPDKNQYKKFKINLENTPNDIAMLKETIERRLFHPEWQYPEIILIDGGIAQLNVAIKVKNAAVATKNIKVISVAKRDKDLYIEDRQGFIPLRSLPQEIYNLVIQLDDEAHRFAITYHKKLRKNSLFQ